jgi:hypothetical protein
MDDHTPSLAAALVGISGLLARTDTSMRVDHSVEHTQPRSLVLLDPLQPEVVPMVTNGVVSSCRLRSVRHTRLSALSIVLSIL